MIKLGIDVGTSTVKLAMLSEGKLTKTWIKRHHGRLLPTIKAGIEAMDLPNGEIMVNCTGQCH